MLLVPPHELLGVGVVAALGAVGLEAVLLEFFGGRHRVAANKNVGVWCDDETLGPSSATVVERESERRERENRPKGILASKLGARWQ